MTCGRRGGESLHLERGGEALAVAGDGLHLPQDGLARAQQPLLLVRAQLQLRLHAPVLPCSSCCAVYKEIKVSPKGFFIYSTSISGGTRPRKKYFFWYQGSKRVVMRRCPYQDGLPAGKGWGVQGGVGGQQARLQRIMLVYGLRRVCPRLPLRFVL